MSVGRRRNGVERKRFDLRKRNADGVTEYHPLRAAQALKSRIPPSNERVVQRVVGYGKWGGEKRRWNRSIGVPRGFAEREKRTNYEIRFQVRFVVHDVPSGSDLACFLQAAFKISTFQKLSTCSKLSLEELGGTGVINRHPNRGQSDLESIRGGEMRLFSVSPVFICILCGCELPQQSAASACASELRNNLARPELANRRRPAASIFRRRRPTSSRPTVKEKPLGTKCFVGRLSRAHEFTCAA